MSLFTRDALRGEPRFRLSKRFRDKLGQAMGRDIPSNSMAWMDFHLDWLYAALLLSVGGLEGV